MKAAILPHQVFIGAPGANVSEWKYLIHVKRYTIIPRIAPALRFFNQYERNHVNPQGGGVDRGLHIWKVCPIPCRNVPCMCYLKDILTDSSTCQLRW